MKEGTSTLKNYSISFNSLQKLKLILERQFWAWHTYKLTFSSSEFRRNVEPTLGSWLQQRSENSFPGLSLVRSALLGFAWNLKTFEEDWFVQRSKMLAMRLKFQQNVLAYKVKSLQKVLIKHKFYLFTTFNFFMWL